MFFIVGKRLHKSNFCHCELRCFLFPHSGMAISYLAATQILILRFFVPLFAVLGFFHKIIIYSNPLPMNKSWDKLGGLSSFNNPTIIPSSLAKNQKIRYFNFIKQRQILSNPALKNIDTKNSLMRAKEVSLLSFQFHFCQFRIG